MINGPTSLVDEPMAYSRHNRLGNDDPDLVEHLGGWGTEDRGRALGKENRPRFK